MIGLEYRRLQLRFLWERRFSSKDFLRFRCNICGKATLAPVPEITSREAPSCCYCGSSLRFRSIIAALSLELFGEIKTIPEMPERKDLAGIGISDFRVYALPLRKKFSYTNTFYHRRPRLDIMKLKDELKGTADFVISSEVFEHVPPPVEKAFSNLFELLKPGGACVFTAPYADEGLTREHFPELYDYRLAGKGGRKVLVNRTRDGRTQVFEDLRFHGGKGSTLEMRLFSWPSLLENMYGAGFRDITVHRDSFPEFGIILDRIDSSYTITMRRPSSSPESLRSGGRSFHSGSR